MSANEQSKAAPHRSKDEKIFLILVIVLAAIAGIGSWIAATALAHRDHPHGILPDQPRRLVAFSLTNSMGHPVTRADLDGKILVVSFLFTSCSLTCPEVSRHMAEIQKLTANDPDVQLLSLTVDPRSDTPSALAKWGAHYGADTNRWMFLTGDQTVEHTLIGESFLKTDPNDPFNYMPGGFTGTDRIAVVDKHGRTRVYFDGLRSETPEAVVAEISRLRAEN